MASDEQEWPYYPFRRNPFLREWRKFRGLTLTELARRVGTTQASLSRYEGGKRRLNAEMLQKLADALTPDGLIPTLFVNPGPRRIPVRVDHGFLVLREVSKVEQELRALLRLWDRMTPSQRRLLIEVAKAIRSAG